MGQFSDEVLNNLRSQLETEKRTLAARIAQLTAQDPFSDPSRLNDNASSDTEASEESSHDRFAAMIDELAAGVAAVDAALMRIAGGSYGMCTSCGNEIEMERLKILPTATLCLTCEKKKTL